MTETETETETVEEDETEPEPFVPEDNTELVLRTWGVGGEPVGWAPSNWQALVQTIRAYNLGFADAATVQTSLDFTFPGMGYQTANVVWGPQASADFSFTVEDDTVTATINSADDYTNDMVSWNFDDGTVARGVTVTRSYGGDVGEHMLQCNVAIAGAVYSTQETFETGAAQPPVVDEPEPVEEDADGSYDPAEHTVDEVLAYAAEHPDEVDAIVVAEEAGKNRVGILDKI